MTRERFGRTPFGGLTRRDVVKLGGALGVSAGFGTLPLHRRRPVGRLRRGAGPDPAVLIDGSDVRALAMRALEAAKAAGAEYADVRLTRSLQQGIQGWNPSVLQSWGGDVGGFQENEAIGVGVRVRARGVWGFAGSPYWDPEEMVALAQEAVAEANANASAGNTSRAIEWTPIPVANGHWSTPIKMDPFVMPIEERIDTMQEWAALASRYRGCSGSIIASFGREEQALATSEGSYVTQTLYAINSSYSLYRSPFIKNGGSTNSATARGLGMSALGWAIGAGSGVAAGWELLVEADIPGQIPALYEAADPRYVPPPKKAGEIGRYDVVFDAEAMAVLLSDTLGVATQIGRAVGDEANAGGTSYLGPDPLALLGSYQAASPLVTVTANRSMRRGLATVKWDAEGVEPEDFALIKNGVLVDYQTTREQAAWLAPYYQKIGKPVRSHGCSAVQDATYVPAQHTPNLVLEPGKESVSFDDLVASTKRGLAVIGLPPRPGGLADYQARTGSGKAGQLREIVNGKLGAKIEGLEFLFNSPTLWQNVVALGGAASADQFCTLDQTGQPAQRTGYSVRAVPAKVKDVDFVDPSRRA